VIARAWKAQTRLCGRFRRMAQTKNTKSVVAAAIARELAGFVWAEMASPLWPAPAGFCSSLVIGV
jgi:hypothetical protein